MGNSASGETGEDYRREEEDDDYAKQFDGIETLGYRVLGVQPDSPGRLHFVVVLVLGGGGGGYTVTVALLVYCIVAS